MKIGYSDINGTEDILTYWRELEDDCRARTKSWIYRGQKADKRLVGLRKLRTSLEKALANCRHRPKDVPKIEGGLFRRFKRRSELFLEHIPEQGDYMEWFALMQHHGAPTRLLDWSYSFFVAIYFAVAELEKDQEGELWAVDMKYLLKRIKRLFPKKADRRCAERDDPNAQVYSNFERMFMLRRPRRFVCPMNPYKFNARLTIQQGMFLCPGDITRPFAENLEAHFPSQKMLNEHLKVFKIGRKARDEIMQMLYSMNIGDASLFPGLDGFAKSLKDVLAFPDAARMFPPDSSYVKGKVWRRI